MTEVKALLPDLLGGMFARLRLELAAADLDGLRFSHLRVLDGVPEGGASVTDLAVRIGMTKQGCGQFVAQLTASGHLEAGRDAADRRVRVVRLTARGVDLLDRTRRATEEAEARFAEQVGARRYATFRRVVDELAARPS